MSDSLDYIHPQLRPLAVTLDTLTLDPKNARKHDERNLGVIRKSLEKFGMRGTIVVQKSGDTLVVRSGNGRVTAARQLRWTHLPALIYEEDDNESVAYAIADNQSSDLSEWDFETLESLVGELRSDDFDLDSLGFSPEELIGFVSSSETLEFEEEPEEPEIAPNPPSYEEDDELPEEVEAITVEGEVVELGPHVLHCGDCIEVMGELADNSIDAVVTDPPYGISMMGKNWDCSVPGDDFAKEALRVLKPGGHLIAFAATRTYHRLACAVEDAGFEIRDQIGWLQWQGFPKSTDIGKRIDIEAGSVGVTSYTGPNHKNGVYGDGMGGGVTTAPYAPATDDAKQWDGWGSALKPATEPAVLARKPLESGLTIAANVLKWGTGALNIDACRMAYGDDAWPGPDRSLEDIRRIAAPNVRTGKLTDTSLNSRFLGGMKHENMGLAGHDLGRWPANIYACKKPARSEKEAGCEELPTAKRDESREDGAPGGDNPRNRGAQTRANSHPTVKPVKLMRWLLELVTPPGGVVLEPFAGSGTTLVAAKKLDLSVIGIEREPKYCDIIRARVSEKSED